MKINLNLGDTQIILKECQVYGLSLDQAAYVLATAWWETAHTMKPVKEAYWVRNASTWRKKNLRYWPWYGRGYVQLTWEDNYIKAGRELGLDLTTDPDSVMEPWVSAKILVLGSREGWFTGKGLGDYINAQGTDYMNARRIINGTDKMREIREVARAYQEELQEIKYGQVEVKKEHLFTTWWNKFKNKVKK